MQDDGDVLVLLEGVVECVRDGRYEANAGDGILVDAVVCGTRCIVVVEDASAPVRLSPREREIARLVAHGYTNQAVASTLDISAWTVSTHLRRIFAKLGVSNRAEMVTRLLGRPELTHRS